MRVEKYFAYKQLPPHLQVISIPFGEIVEKINAGKDKPSDYSELVKKAMAFESNDPSFSSICRKKIREAQISDKKASKLLLLWEAKNHAVCAAIPK